MNSWNSTAHLYLCPICSAPIEITGAISRKFQYKNGIVLNFGYSKGGWGFRQNSIDFSSEVCVECFEAFVPLVEKIIETKDSRDGINAGKQGDTDTSQRPNRKRFLGLLGGQ